MPNSRITDSRWHDRAVRGDDGGYRYPGGMRGGEPDEIWRQGEYRRQLYGGEVGAETPSGTAGISRYAPRGRRYGSQPRGYVRSDERLHDDVCQRLANSGLDVTEISVYVTQGRVRLEGEAPDRFTKHCVEDMAEACWGVTDVDNRIRVRDAASRVDAHARRREP